jgi:hypothetical protein
LLRLELAVELCSNVWSPSSLLFPPTVNSDIELSPTPILAADLRDWYGFRSAPDLVYLRTFGTIGCPLASTPVAASNFFTRRSCSCSLRFTNLKIVIVVHVKMLNWPSSLLS